MPSYARHLYLFVDNQYALNVSIGKWQAKAHRPLIATIRELIAALRQTTILTIGWVPEHANVDGNDKPTCSRSKAHEHVCRHQSPPHPQLASAAKTHPPSKSPARSQPTC